MRSSPVGYDRQDEKIEWLGFCGTASAVQSLDLGRKYRYNTESPFDLLAEGASKNVWWSLAAEYRTFFAQNAWFTTESLSFLNHSKQSHSGNVLLSTSDRSV